jgi:hypothetical protein
MKRTILFTSLAIIFGSALYVHEPTKAVGSNTDSNKTIVSGSSIVTECPVVGKNYKTETVVDNEHSIYEHCNTCNTGVFLEDKEGTNRCTFCGKLK